MKAEKAKACVLERIRRNGSQFTVPFYVKEVGKKTYGITYSFNKALRIPEKEVEDVREDLDGNCTVRQVIAIT